MFEQLADALVFGAMRMDPADMKAKAIHFFVMDTVKIFVLLAVVITAVSYVRSYFPATRTRRLLAGRKHLSYIVAGALGVVTPFCSCSAVPMFIGFVESGIPLGVTMTFLIATPIVNEVALALLFGLFGSKIAALYLASGLAIALFGGGMIGALGLERYVEGYVWELKFDQIEDVIPSQHERVVQALSHMRLILSRVWIYVVVGIGVGALIHGYVPESVLQNLVGAQRWYSVPLAVVAGVPLYGNVGGTLPVIHALVQKGVPIGTALALMMSITAISLPELILLRRVLKPVLLAVFTGLVAAAIVATGYMFNAIL